MQIKEWSSSVASPCMELGEGSLVSTLALRNLVSGGTKAEEGTWVGGRTPGFCSHICHDLSFPSLPL